MLRPAQTNASLAAPPESSARADPVAHAACRLHAFDSTRGDTNPSLVRKHWLGLPYPGVNRRRPRVPVLAIRPYEL
jgi:hypothetical protein